MVIAVFLKAQRTEEARIIIKAKVPFLSVLSQTEGPSLPFLSVHVPVCVVFKLGICNSLQGQPMASPVKTNVEKFGFK